MHLTLPGAGDAQVREVKTLPLSPCQLPCWNQSAERVRMLDFVDPTSGAQVHLWDGGMGAWYINGWLYGAEKNFTDA